MQSMARLLGLTLCVTLLLLSACAPAPQDAQRRRPKVYQSVVSLSPVTSEIFSNFFFEMRLIGRTRSCDFPQSVQQVEVVGDVKPDYEKISRLAPSVVVYDKALYNEADLEKLKQLNIELYEYDVKTLDQYKDWLVRAGAKFGAETEISEYVDKIVAARESNLAAGGPKRRVMLVLGGGTGEYMAAGTGTIQADFLRASGYEPVGPSVDKFATVNIESFLQLKPDAIVVAGDAARLLADPRLKSLPAVQNKKVVAIKDQNLILRAGARVDTLLASLRPAVEGIFEGN